MDFYDPEIKDVTDRHEDRCSLSYRQFQRYKNGEVKKPSKRVVIAICLSMKRPFTTSCTVCLLTGFVFTYSFENAILLQVLEHFVGKTLEEINEEFERL